MFCLIAFSLVLLSTQKRAVVSAQLQTGLREVEDERKSAMIHGQQ
jgi:hypothetical protein